MYIQIKENHPKLSVKIIVACFLVKETADLHKKGINDKKPIDLIASQEERSLIEYFSQE